MFDEKLIFEHGAPGRRAVSLPPDDLPVDLAAADAFALEPALAQPDLGGLPELSELEVVRHYTRLSQWNFAITTNFYPLGSCTMKYNPAVNEWAARLPGFAGIHPLWPDSLTQGALGLLWELERMLAAVSGLDAVTLTPAAGAQGEFVGIKVVRAYHESRGDPRRKVLIPASAHGTNPATSTLCGYEVVEVPAGADGLLHLSDVEPLLDDQVAAIMITNPNTLGLFEREIAEIAAALHRVDALVYIDGANLNALCGVTRPGDFGADILHINLHKTFSTPHGGGGPGAGPVCVRRDLEPFLPVPRIVRTDGGFHLSSDAPQAIGRVRTFQGNFGILVRAFTFMAGLGGDGMTRMTERAVLNANYLRVRLQNRLQIAFDEPCLHECVFSDRTFADTGVKTIDVAKGLLDRGFHAPTVYFPLVVSGALMIEPTETESRETLDDFVTALDAVLDDARRAPDALRAAPLQARVRRLDETRAARKPVLRWRPAAESAPGVAPSAGEPRGSTAMPTVADAPAAAPGVSAAPASDLALEASGVSEAESALAAPEAPLPVQVSAAPDALDVPLPAEALVAPGTADAEAAAPAGAMPAADESTEAVPGTVAGDPTT